MASPTTPVGGTAADAAVGRLVVGIQAGLDELVEGIVARIRDELPTSAGCPPRPSRERCAATSAGRRRQWPS